MGSDYSSLLKTRSLDYDELEMQVGGGIDEMPGINHPHAVGNNIYSRGNEFKPDGSVSEVWMDLLAHESGPVWQFQNDGASYIGML